MEDKAEKITTAFFANKVRKTLHKKIKGYSNCWVKGDVLVADIQLKGVPHLHLKRKIEHV